ncbi:uncharacterized protein LAESUDRAFT_664963 [Laetiporus sulphureus 93-53]|uniref:Uncharacterized protein n=1 Tax=Laetiporus sulphureus 93-53 TaxID=1314785 RepID=A0A165BFQ9_9APHY|nr:uncharacterized protein LAESUDRAFT_664963 [Laetiporus sulphureus 93-53]KZT00961.1 hypothetical protein LAESUDRAFT_664963 [Laetiporus sulphureus 93-53]
MNTYIHISLIGGTDGGLFNDLHVATDKDGGPLIRSSGQLTLDVSHPIARIVMSHSWEICSTSVIPSIIQTNHHHRLMAWRSLMNAAKCFSTATEVILAIYGRAGYQNYHKCKLINSMSFVIFDKATATSHIEGPFSNGDGSNNGESFHVSNVMAFGGYAKPAEQRKLD